MYYICTTQRKRAENVKFNKRYQTSILYTDNDKNKIRCNVREGGKKKLAAVGFEPTPPKRLVP